jgi:hypothetical protein
MFDFHTADNAPNPHVKVYNVQSQRTICIIPIEHGDVSEAEAFAEIFIEALRAQE